MRKLACLFIISLFLGNYSFSQIENPVTWSFTSEPGKDGTFNLTFKATMQSTWHLYSQHIPENGPVPTSFKFETNKNYEIVGKVNELSKVISFYDKSFEMEVKYFGHEALFVQKIKVKSNEAFKVKGTVEYMCCNDQKCLPPKSVDFEFSIPKTLPSKVSISREDKSVSAKSAIIPKIDTVSKIDSSKIGASVPTKTQATQIKSEVSDKGKEPESAWGFLFYAFFWGLAGVLTPCVYPMIPMTVSFFMRGEEKRSRGILKGLMFGLSIIIIYTLIGLLVSLSILSENVGNILSTHWISNSIFFLLFLIFGASFLGMFEIVLPSFLVNKIDQQAEKGGFWGPFFMALTLVVVSFSCTGPIVSDILIKASRGLSSKPIAGMFGYSLAFALPFTFFALFPSLLKSLPKSGGWLNSVKVVLGFILLAFGLTFIANIDQNYHLNLLSRNIFLIIWIVLSVLLGFYFLGKIKFAHDSDILYVGVPRFLLVVVIFSFALYLFTGLFGTSLKPLSWILPPEENKIKLNQQDTNVNTNALCGTPKYSNFLPTSKNLVEYFEYNEGMACAKQKNKPVLLDFKGHSCKNCKIMEANVWTDPRVLESLRNDFIIIGLYTDDKFELPEKEWITKPNGKVLKRMDEINQDIEISKFENNALPLYAILDVNGNVLGKPIEFTNDTEAYLKFLQEGKEAFDKKK